jgi:hypothetical protein
MNKREIFINIFKSIPTTGHVGHKVVRHRGSHIIHKLTDDGEVVNRRPRSFMLGAVSSARFITQLKGLDQLNPVTSSGIKLPAFLLVAQCLKQIRCRVPTFLLILQKMPFTNNDCY